MLDFMYPTQAELDQRGNESEWVRDMLNDWEASGQVRLCFPYARMPNKTNFPYFLANNTDQDEPFWLYMYYRKAFAMGGQIRFRIHVIERRDDRYRPPENVHFCENFPGMQVTIRFNCDKFEEISLKNGEPLRIEHFWHPKDMRLPVAKRKPRRLPALMRNPSVGIPPVVCTEELDVIHSYPLV